MKKYFLLMAAIFSLAVAHAQTRLSTAISELFSNSFYLTFSGNLETKKTNEKALVVVVNSSGQAGEFDKALVLIKDEAADFPDITSKNSEVFITVDGRSAIILDNDRNEIFVIGLDEAGTKKVNTTLLGSLSTAKYVSDVKFLSFGLSFLTGQWAADSIAVVTHTDPFNYLAAADMTGKMMVVPEADDDPIPCTLFYCDGGGPGSSSCAAENPDIPGQRCEVKCKSGYFACCNIRVLRCRCCKGE